MSSGMGRATVLEVGQSEFGGAAQLQSTGAKLGPGPPVQLPWAQLMAVARAGVAPNVEAGARVWAMDVLSLQTLGAAADGKWQWRRGEWIDVALCGSLFFQRTALGGWPWHSTGAAVPLLVGLNLGPHQLVATVRLAGGALSGQSQTTQWFLGAGASLGIDFAIGRWHLFPEVAIGGAPVKWNGTHDDPQRTGASVFEIGIGLWKR